MVGQSHFRRNLRIGSGASLIKFRITQKVIEKVFLQASCSFKDAQSFFREFSAEFFKIHISVISDKTELC